jgi:hypothetical protein
MNHRIRHAFKPLIHSGKLGGEVEIDEGFFGVKNKPKMQVVALIERGGEVRTKIIDRISHRNVGQFMRDNIARGSTLNTDGKEWRERAGVALDISLAEKGIKQSENLSRQTDGLMSQVGALIHIADEQKNLAVKLERQTNKLI